MPIDQLAEPDDLRASIEAQFDAISGSDAESGGGDGGGTPAAVQDEPAATPGDTVPAAGDRARGPDGKFISKAEGAPEPDRKGDRDKAAAPADIVPAAKTEPDKASAQPASPPADAPPAGWPPDAKAEWSKLSPALKAAVLKREAEISAGGQQWSEQRRQYERVLSPVAQEAAKLGMSTEQGLNALLAAHHALNRDPQQAIRSLAQQYGVDLATLAGSPPADPQRETVQPVQPDIRALVQQAVQPILAPFQQRWDDEARRQADASTAFVTTFAEAPGHEHFNAVADEIMALVPLIKQANPAWSREQVLQDAYDRATYANPTVRTSILAEEERRRASTLAAQQAKADEERRNQARAHAAKARTAASSVTGSRTGEPAAGPKDSLREEIIAAMNGG